MFRLVLALTTAKRLSSFDLATSNINVRGLSQKIRALLRETAQPVAVVTSFMPGIATTRPHSTPSPGSAQPFESIPSTFHGATLSSFTSISMAPHHLVSFSLRGPSRTSPRWLLPSPPLPLNHPSTWSSTSSLRLKHMLLSSSRDRTFTRAPSKTTASNGRSPVTVFPYFTVPSVHCLAELLAHHGR